MHQYFEKLYDHGGILVYAVHDPVGADAARGSPESRPDRRSGDAGDARYGSRRAAPIRSRSRAGPSWSAVHDQRRVEANHRTFPTSRRMRSEVPKPGTARVL